MAAPTAIAFAPFLTYPTTASTSWFSPVGMAAGQATQASGTLPETSVQSRIGFAGTINNATAYIISNGRSTVSHIVMWLNGAPSTLDVVVGAGITGIVQDTTHSLSVAVDDTISIEVQNGALTGQIRLGSYVAQFVPSSGSAKQKLCSGGLTTSNSTSGFTVFLSLGGDMNSNTTENNSSVRANVAGTYSDYSINVITNARTTNGRMRLRKNGGNGAGDVTITAATTGIFKDTANTDAVVESDLVSLVLVGGSGATAFVYDAAGCWVTATTDGEQLLCCSQRGTITDNRFLGLFGAGFGSITESVTKACLGMAGTLSLMSLRVSANSSSADITYRLRINGADGNQGFIFSAGATGLFTDTSNTDTIAATDLLDQSITGTNGSVTTRSAGIKFNSASGTTYNESVSESVSAADTVDNAATLVGTTSESMSTADTVSSLVVSPSTISETVSLADTTTNIATQSGDISENASLSDAVSSLVDFGVSQDEAIVANDNVSSLVVFPSTVSETISPDETVSTSQQWPVDVAEAVGLADAQSSSAELGGAVSESVALADSQTNTAVLVGDMSEAAGLSDTVSALVDFVTDISEAATLTDFVSALRDLAADIQETITFVDVFTALAPIVIDPAYYVEATPRGFSALSANRELGVFAQSRNFAGLAN